MTVESCYKYDNKMLIYTKLGNCQYTQNIWKVFTQVFMLINSIYHKHKIINCNIQLIYLYRNIINRIIAILNALKVILTNYYPYGFFNDFLDKRCNDRYWTQSTECQEVYLWIWIWISSRVRSIGDKMLLFIDNLC